MEKRKGEEDFAGKKERSYSSFAPLNLAERCKAPLVDYTTLNIFQHLENSRKNNTKKMLQVDLHTTGKGFDCFCSFVQQVVCTHTSRQNTFFPTIVLPLCFAVCVCVCLFLSFKGGADANIISNQQKTIMAPEQTLLAARFCGLNCLFGRSPLPSFLFVTSTQMLQMHEKAVQRQAEIQCYVVLCMYLYTRYKLQLIFALHIKKGTHIIQVIKHICI